MKIQTKQPKKTKKNKTKSAPRFFLVVGKREETKATEKQCRKGQTQETGRDGGGEGG